MLQRYSRNAHRVQPLSLGFHRRNAQECAFIFLNFNANKFGIHLT